MLPQPAKEIPQKPFEWAKNEKIYPSFEKEIPSTITVDASTGTAPVVFNSSKVKQVGKDRNKILFKITGLNLDYSMWVVFHEN